eukprot:12929210-Prorocentrum_lima.AAC.1
MDILALPHAQTLCIKLRLPTAVGGLPAPSPTCEAAYLAAILQCAPGLRQVLPDCQLPGGFRDVR